MSRVIKFRAWNSVDNCMVHPSVVIYRIKALVESRHYTVMQFTGLHDKKGVDIYESDIVEYEMGSDTDVAVVVYDDMAVRFRFKCDGDSFSGYGVNKDDVKKLVKVIGNIHENPELMERGK